MYVADGSIEPNTMGDYVQGNNSKQNWKEYCFSMNFPFIYLKFWFYIWWCHFEYQLSWY